MLSAQAVFPIAGRLANLTLIVPTMVYAVLMDAPILASMAKVNNHFLVKNQ